MGFFLEGRKGIRERSGIELIYFILILFFFHLGLSTPVRFEFRDYPQAGGIAGDSFDLHIVALLSNGQIDSNYNGRALLKTSQDDFWSYVYPSLLDFRFGEVRTRAFVTKACRLRLIATDGTIQGMTDSIPFFPNFPKRFLVILPGETLYPGSPSGRYSPPYNPPSPYPQTAGQSFSVSVYLVDKHFNVVKTQSCTLTISSSDTFAIYPPLLYIVSGKADFSFTPRSRGKRVIFASSPQYSDVSSNFLVNPGAYQGILLLLPGEEMLFGDTARSSWMTPGKRGNPLPQFVGDTFPVKVYCIDTMYNPTSGNDSVELFSEYPFSYYPKSAPLHDSATLFVSFNSSGENQNLWGKTKNFESYRCRLKIFPKAAQIRLPIKEDTIYAGAEKEIEIQVFDASGAPIPYKVVKFKVIKGSGRFKEKETQELNDSVEIITDSTGIGRAIFICPVSNLREQVSERDSIAVRADALEGRFSLWVEVGDQEVARGNLIAFPNPFGTINQNWTTIMYHLARAVDVKFLIYDPFGNPVYERLIKKQEMGARAGVNKITWDGTDKQGRRVASGIYHIRIIGIAHTGKVIDRGWTIGVIW